MTKTQTKSVMRDDDSALAEIETYLANVADNLKKISEIFVARCDESPNFYDKFRQRFPRITAGFIAGLERVGRGLMMPDLLMIGADQQRWVSRLPMHQQKKIVQEGVPVVLTSGEVKTLPVQAMPHALLQQVIDDKSGSIRSPKEQETFIADSKNKAEKVLAPRKMNTENKQEVRFRVIGRMLEIIDPPIVLTEVDVRALLAEMVRKK
jgi:hypothetical protein